MPAPKKSLAATALLTDLITGLWTTLRYTFKPNVTVRYPLERSVLHPNYRGILRVDDDLCIACFLCEKICPDNCIVLEGEKGLGKGSKYASYFSLDHARCLFCGLCEEVCPVDAIYHSNEFEGATYNRADLVHDLAILHKGHAIVHYER